MGWVAPAAQRLGAFLASWFPSRRLRQLISVPDHQTTHTTFLYNLYDLYNERPEHHPNLRMIRMKAAREGGFQFA